MSPSDSFDLFDCGVIELNTFLKNYALLYLSRRFGITVLCHLDEGPKRIIGFYTIAPAHISLNELPNTFLKGPKPNPIPAFRLCRLAVDLVYQGQGIGQVILFDAFKRCLAGSSFFGGAVLIVDAKDERIALFYRQYGFVPLPNHPLCLILNLKHIAKYIEE